MDDPEIGPNPSGLCMCGCGQRTPLATYSHGPKGNVQGKPTRFVKGHRTPNIPDPPIVQDGVALIPLYSRKFPGLYAIVDLEDAERVAQHRWNVDHARNTFYAKTKSQRTHGTHLAMHRLVLELAPGDPGPDHINGNGLDNRRSNLRSANESLNGANHQHTKRGSNPSSVFRGVCWSKDRQKWQATICVDGKRRQLGRFESEVDAACAWDVAATEAWGDFAKLNFPLGDQS